MKSRFMSLILLAYIPQQGLGGVGQPPLPDETVARR
jgi:hypothetical protein